MGRNYKFRAELDYECSRIDDVFDKKPEIEYSTCPGGPIYYKGKCNNKTVVLEFCSGGPSSVVSNKSQKVVEGLAKLVLEKSIEVEKKQMERWQ